jgi:hypothetical protein
MSHATDKSFGKPIPFFARSHLQLKFGDLAIGADAFSPKSARRYILAVVLDRARSCWACARFKSVNRSTDRRKVVEGLEKETVGVFFSEEFAARCVSIAIANEAEAVVGMWEK